MKWSEGLPYGSEPAQVSVHDLAMSKPSERGRGPRTYMVDLLESGAAVVLEDIVVRCARGVDELLDDGLSAM